MEAQYKAMLAEMGYNPQLKGMTYFVALVDEVRNLLREKSYDMDEILPLLPAYYLEYYHFDAEIGKNIFMEEITKFCSRRNKTEISNKKYLEVMGMEEDLSMDQTLVAFCSYINFKEDELKQIYKEEEEPKVLTFENKPKFS